MKLVEGFDSNYRYVLVAARRARQIQNGARPVVETPTRKPCRIAEEEIQAGRVKWEVPQAEKTPFETAAEILEPVGRDSDD
jgi:DNA-directed RNA polymerase subunit omega